MDQDFVGPDIYEFSVTYGLPVENLHDLDVEVPGSLAALDHIRFGPSADRDDLAVLIRSASHAGRSRRSKASSDWRNLSTFSCDIAYSRSPTASRAFGCVGKNSMRLILSSVTV